MTVFEWLRARNTRPTFWPGQSADALFQEEEGRGRLPLFYSSMGKCNPATPSVAMTLPVFAITAAVQPRERFVSSACQASRSRGPIRPWPGFKRPVLAAGFQDAKSLKKDEDLTDLSNRADFKKLVADLEAPKEKK